MPSSEGYRYCSPCKRWSASTNVHCDKCQACTSKVNGHTTSSAFSVYYQTCDCTDAEYQDGRTYVHCDICQRCVKPTYKHCKACARCKLPEHQCQAGNHQHSEGKKNATPPAPIQQVKTYNTTQEIKRKSIEGDHKRSKSRRKQKQNGKKKYYGSSSLPGGKKKKSKNQ